jgi:putative glutamine amidotransferase
MKETKKVLIGLSPRILRDVPREIGMRGKTLQYLEQSMAHWAMRLGAVVVMIPTVETAGQLSRWEVATQDYVSALDGLILQGGADIEPSAYGETRTAQVGPADAVRDSFELELLRGFAAADKPVLGVCRGMQLINVAYGGTLHHDLQHSGATAHSHRMLELYDEHAHEVDLVEGGWLQSLYRLSLTNLPGRTRVNSIHHQGVKRLGTDLVIEAVATDGVIEAIRQPQLNFMLGVQWHPEFHDTRFPNLLPPDPLLKAFLDAAARRRAEGA